MPGMSAIFALARHARSNASMLTCFASTPWNFEEKKETAHSLEKTMKENIWDHRFQNVRRV